MAINFLDPNRFVLVTAFVATIGVLVMNTLIERDIRRLDEKAAKRRLTNTRATLRMLGHAFSNGKS